MNALRHLRKIGILLLLVMAIGTAGYHFIEGWPWFDGFYMVVTTLTTIGYQEVHPPVACRAHLQRVRDFLRRVSASVGNRVAESGFARIRAAKLLRKAAHGARNRTSRRALHHLRHGTRGPQRGAGTGTQARTFRDH